MEGAGGNMIKSRCTYLCNVKLVLIVLVVLGHSLEQVGAQESILYRIIYLFHMPLFAFVTGLHLKAVKSCLKQARTSLILYTIIQGLLVLAGWLMGNPFASLTVPFWHLWYLLSMCMWAVMAAGCCLWLEKHPRGGAVLLLAAVAGCLLCGALPLGRFLSLSRTVCFFPFVLLGILCPVELQEGLKAGTRICMAAAGLLGILPAWGIARHVPYDFFYHAAGYAEFSMSVGEGCFLRAVSLIAAVCLGMLVLAAVPAAKLPVTKIGGDTLPAYLLHVVFMPLLKPFWEEGRYGWLVCFSVLVVLLIWELGRWSRPLYTVLRQPYRG